MLSDSPSHVLSSKYALNGAHPVPGPIITTGVCGTRGNENVPDTTHTGIVLAVESDANHVEHIPYHHNTSFIIHHS